MITETGTKYTRLTAALNTHRAAADQYAATLAQANALGAVVAAARENPDLDVNVLEMWIGIRTARVVMSRLDDAIITFREAAAEVSIARSYLPPSHADNITALHTRFAPAPPRISTPTGFAAAGPAPTFDGQPAEGWPELLPVPPAPWRRVDVPVTGEPDGPTRFARFDLIVDGVVRGLVTFSSRGPNHWRAPTDGNTRTFAYAVDAIAYVDRAVFPSEEI